MGEDHSIHGLGAVAAVKGRKEKVKGPEVAWASCPGIVRVAFELLLSGRLLFKGMTVGLRAMDGV
jgi:hypothetical protein